MREELEVKKAEWIQKVMECDRSHLELRRRRLEDEDIRGEYTTHAGYLKETSRINYTVAEGNVQKLQQKSRGPQPVQVPMRECIQLKRAVF